MLKRLPKIPPTRVATTGNHGHGFEESEEGDPLNAGEQEEVAGTEE